jgi:hypothetical protein
MKTYELLIEQRQPPAADAPPQNARFKPSAPMTPWHTFRLWNPAVSWKLRKPPKAW